MLPSALPVANAIMLMIGKSGAAGAFATIYIYTSELFPTSARNTAVGVCSMVGRIAAMLAPELAVLVSAYLRHWRREGGGKLLNGGAGGIFGIMTIYF